MFAEVRNVGSRLVCVLLAAVVLAGCDKCGNAVKFNAPSLPKTCGDNTDPSR